MDAEVECKYLIYTCTQREEKWAAYVNFGHFWLIPLTEAMNDNQNIKLKKNIWEKKYVNIHKHIILRVTEEVYSYVYPSEIMGSLLLMNTGYCLRGQRDIRPTFVKVTRPRNCDP